jgi:formylmethanofuran dehydrogenase subunit B
MDHAWISGKPAALDAAVAEAVKLLAASRRPLIAGLGTDIAGARATITLAKRIGASIDHMNSGALLRDLDVMRSSGVVLTTPGETRVRADTLLLIGPGLVNSGLVDSGLVDSKLGAAGTELPRLLAGMRQMQSEIGTEPRIFWLCPRGDLAAIGSAAATIEAIGKEPRDLPALVAALRARRAGRPAGRIGVSSKTLDQISNGLKAARFGVAIWSAAALDALVIEMVCGLVNDLNATTRFCGLPLASANNAVGILQICGWMTGLPMRTGFGRGFAEHDPWLFDSQRLVERGETDCALWISAYRAAAPEWCEPPPIIALTGRGAAFRAPPRVFIEVGCPGVDHAAVQHLASTGALTAVEATQPSDTISVAGAIARIASALPASGTLPC